MSLSVLTSKRRRRTFITYDFEWIPGTLEIRLCGVYDGERYRAYRSIKSFINGELTSRNRGKWFYAHAGGLADFQFVLEELARRTGKFEVKCAFSGSSAIIVQVTRGKNAWTFIDSYWLLRDKLDNIGKWIGIHKGAEEERKTKEGAKEFYTNASLHELLEYNEGDCIILWKAIDALQDVLWDLGGQLQKTLASSAMILFRRRFLTENIDTSWAINERAQQAYFASRVEVISENCYDAEYYDINSSFPYAMTKPCPGNFIGSTRSIPDYGIYLADVTIEVPECFLPPIPTKIKGRLFFPTGIWRSWLTSVDIELLLREGCTLHRVWECLQFEPFFDLAEYAKTLYTMRKNAETSFERTALKLLLNSLYGKFAEGEEKSALHLNPKKIDRDNWEMLFPGAWLYEKRVPVPHRHVPISAHITAIGRRTIFDFMNACSEVHYCDTDGFSTVDSLATTNDLGGLKLEKRIRHGHFVQCKFYRLEGEELQKDGTWEELGDKGVKGKGFPGMDIAKFERLLEGHSIAYERMRRIKEQARKGRLEPQEHVINKRLQRNVLSKRFHYPDGTTRPWQMKELAEYFRGNRQY